MSISIFKKGIADSLQNKGHYGQQNMGVQVGGYMDYLSAQLANHILGNALESSVYEIHFPAGQFQFNESATICITGAHFVPIINNKSIAMHCPIEVHAGDTLQFLQPLQGRITYMAIKEKYKSSKDHCIWKKNDALIESIEHQIFDTQAFHFIPGPAWKDLTEASMELLLSSHFQITMQSNRMGFQLQGPSLKTVENTSYLSSAVTRGTMQLLPNGQLIILMADHQTVGGYPNIGQIILVDLPRLAQSKANTAIQFRLTHINYAHEQYQSLYEKFAY